MKVVVEQFLIREFFEDEGGPRRTRPGKEPPPRYNIAPTQPIFVVRQDGDARVLDLMRWGLVPSWSKDLKLSLINARSESAATKPAFRGAMKRRRCLIPANGFYEWQKLDDKRKQPHLIRMADEGVFALAGLYEWWGSDDGSELVTCAILTTSPNEMMVKIHDRMPVILDAEHYDRWLDPSNEDAGSVSDLLRPYPAELMMAMPVSTYVNSARHDDAKCIESIEDKGLWGQGVE